MHPLSGSSPSVGGCVSAPFNALNTIVTTAKPEAFLYDKVVWQSGARQSTIVSTLESAQTAPATAQIDAISYTPETTEKSESTSSHTKAAAGPSAPKFCRYCGTKLSAETAFCANCGGKLK